jgi:hypothetical protein
MRCTVSALAAFTAGGDVHFEFGDSLRTGTHLMSAGCDLLDEISTNRARAGTIPGE